MQYMKLWCFFPEDAIKQFMIFIWTMIFLEHLFSLRAMVRMQFNDNFVTFLWQNYIAPGAKDYIIWRHGVFIALFKGALLRYAIFIETQTKCDLALHF